MEQPIHLILGSGGARGLAHIGVIRELEAQGYEIARITGCSMGALIGGLYAAGKLEEYESWVMELSRFDVLRFLDVSFSTRNGMVKGDRIMDRLGDWVGGIEIRDLKLPFTAVAADIVHGKEVWIEKGDLINTIRSSISVPGLFTPFEMNGMLLVDGGILNPLPIPPISIENSYKTVAVSLSGRALKNPFGDTSPAKAQQPEKTLIGYRKKVADFLENLQETFGLENEEKEAKKLHAMSFTDVMMGMFNTMQDTIARYQLAGNPPDILIEIPENICSAHEFDKAQQLIPAGAYWTKKALQEQLNGEA